MHFRALAIISCCLLASVTYGETVSYEFDISTTSVNITGEQVEALAIDGQIPAPTIRAQVGDTLRVTFNNTLDVMSSIHWHGILLPPDQDGVSYLNTQPIEAGSSHTFEFPITHAGTFWYHSHTNFQIQRGLYGAIVLEEQSSEDKHDEVIVLSDWTDSDVNRVLKNLKSSDEFYAFSRDNVQSWDKVIANGPEAIRNRLSSSFNRMSPMDLADVHYDAFLSNGKKESSIVPADERGETIKLRIVNGSTSSYFDLEYAGGPMTIVAADGMNVEPLRVNKLRIATAETYDIIVPVSADIAYELRANSFDGSGYSSTFIGDGEKRLAPDMPAPNLFLSSHGGMGHDMGSPEHQDMQSDMSENDHMHGHDHHSDAAANRPANDHSMHSAHTPPSSTDSHAAMDHSMHQASQSEPPVIDHLTDYSSLRSLESTTLPSTQTWRNINLSLTGSMERYVWSFNGKTFRESPQILIKKGENLRLNFSNETMMHHPLHLHGHFFRVVNGAGDYSPLKHTVDVPPMGSVTIEFDANETQDWLFHCHNQYHMKSGMNRVFSYEGSSIFDAEIKKKIQPKQRFFQVHEFHLMSSFADYEYMLFDERHEFALELESDVAGEEEALFIYGYHFNRYLSAFAGYQEREHEIEENRDASIAGFRLTLPFLIESEWRVDDTGDFRLELESSIALSKHLYLDWRVNSDHEYRYGLNYRLNSRWAITAHKDKEYGSGVGIKFFY
ncbi:MAG: multicopper oxidase domain-containing protein [Pseudohongiellaceae bacterium]|nr:multicopper oxidase domain-containing protein [Pseudohongiellaceae bacterium]